MENNIKIRLGRLSDGPAVGRIHYRSHTITWLEFREIDDWTRSRDLELHIKEWSDYFANIPEDEQTWVACLDNAVVGQLTLEPLTNEAIRSALPICNNSKMAYLRSVYVDHDHIGKGVGRRLMLTAMRHLAESDHHAAYLRVIERNTRARHFYEAAGWKLLLPDPEPDENLVSYWIGRDGIEKQAEIPIVGAEQSA